MRKTVLLLALFLAFPTLAGAARRDAFQATVWQPILSWIQGH